MQRQALKQDPFPQLTKQLSRVRSLPKMMNDWSTIKVKSKLCRAKANENPHYSVNLGVHSKHSIIERLAALFFSQRGLKALENQMFKLAVEGVYNNFPSDMYCTLQKVLQAESVRRRPDNKLEKSFLKNV